MKCAELSPSSASFPRSCVVSPACRQMQRRSPVCSTVAALAREVGLPVAILGAVASSRRSAFARRGEHGTRGVPCVWPESSGGVSVSSARCCPGLRVEAGAVCKELSVDVGPVLLVPHTWGRGGSRLSQAAVDRWLRCDDRPTRGRLTSRETDRSDRRVEFSPPAACSRSRSGVLHAGRRLPLPK